ncbi:MAG: phosphoribosylglycinamide formyltransferase [Actinomycetia bacterium]|nr:phosphoribosylglycinamide formyltransferase [Actinomycetes bacterium]
MQALLNAATRADWPGEVSAVVTDRPDVGALSRAREAGVAVATVAPTDYASREEWDAALRDTVAAFAPDWVVSAGFMRLLGASFLQEFPGRIVNTHPALLPSFPGAHGVKDALAYGVKVTGCTVHLVDEGMDTGPILAQDAIAVSDSDSEQTLHDRIKLKERELLVSVVATLIQQGYTVEGRKVRMP